MPHARQDAREDLTMMRFVLAGLLALPAITLFNNSAQAQCGFGGCGNVCMAFGSRMHMHGPLYNYSGGGGGYRCGNGSYGCNSGSNRWPMSRGWAGGNCGGGHCGGGLFAGGLFHRDGCHSCGHGGWGHYAVSTFRNVFHRIHPFASRCGHSCSVGCSSGCGVSGGCSSCGGAVAAIEAPAMAPVISVPVAMTEHAK